MKASNRHRQETEQARPGLLFRKGEKLSTDNFERMGMPVCFSPLFHDRSIACVLPILLKTR